VEENVDTTANMTEHGDDTDGDIEVAPIMEQP
jgi:hypothetical protein